MGFVKSNEVEPYISKAGNFMITINNGNGDKDYVSLPDKVIQAWFLHKTKKITQNYEIKTIRFGKFDEYFKNKPLTELRDELLKSRLSEDERLKEIQKRAAEKIMNNSRYGRYASVQKALETGEELTPTEDFRRWLRNQERNAVRRRFDFLRVDEEKDISEDN